MTKTHTIIQVILVFQFSVLFAQILFCLSRPKDHSRSRFLVLVITYIVYNIFSQIFSNDLFTGWLSFQNTIAYSVRIIVIVYFIYYLHKEFNLHLFKYIKNDIFFWVLPVSLISFSTIYHYFAENLSLSRKLFITVLLCILFAFFYQLSKELIKTYKISHSKESNDRYYGIRIIANYFGLFTLSLIPVIIIAGNGESMEWLIVNSGFIIIAITYIAALVYQSKKESELLSDPGQKLNVDKKNKNAKVPEKVTRKILEGLKNFEENKLFLNKNINTNYLAKKLNTNTRYLSKTINDYKDLSFNHYINKLRIDYISSLLKNEAKFRYYTIKHLAEEAGFNTTDAFSRAFRNHTGKKPSEYIAELLNNE